MVDVGAEKRDVLCAPLPSARRSPGCRDRRRRPRSVPGEHRIGAIEVDEGDGHPAMLGLVAAPEGGVHNRDRYASGQSTEESTASRGVGDAVTVGRRRSSRPSPFADPGPMRTMRRVRSLTTISPAVAVPSMDTVVLAAGPVTISSCVRHRPGTGQTARCGPRWTCAGSPAARGPSCGPLLGACAACRMRSDTPELRGRPR